MIRSPRTANGFFDVDWIPSHIPLNFKKNYFFLDISLFQSSKQKNNNGENMK
jgi:hypothetical protein